MVDRVTMSLSGSTSTGAGSIRDLLDLHRTFGLQAMAAVTGAATAIIALQGTLDGTNWFNLTTWTSGTQAWGDIVWSVDKPVAQVRANMTTYLTSAASAVIARIVSVP